MSKLTQAFLLYFILNLTTSVYCANQNNNNKHNNNNNNNNNNSNNINKNSKNNNQDEHSNQELWQQDLTDTFKIEGSDQGIQKVNLKCGSNSMNVILETEKAFTGVMYTRGSFYKQSAPCFVKSNNSNARSLEMNFKLDQCQTAKEGELYSNVVVIQNDPELITPGDSAFSLECDFRQPRNIDVEANMQTRDRIASRSKITLTSPDPSESLMAESNNAVQNNTDTVTYTPKQKSTKKERLHLGTVEEEKRSK